MNDSQKPDVKDPGARKQKPDAKKPVAGKKPGAKKLDVKTVRLGFAALLVVVAVIVGAVVLLGGDDSDNGSSESSSEEGKEVVALSESELLARASSLGHVVYWIGPRVGTESYELTTSSDGDVYIRYLIGGAEAGDPKSEFLTVGTYPVADATQALQMGADAAEGGPTVSREDGYEVLGSEDETNAYVVFDDQPELQVEIYSPQTGEANDLATSGALKPLG